MNNLVAYGDDSDEESPQRAPPEAEFGKNVTDQRSSVSPRPRRNSDMFFEDADDVQAGSPRNGSSSVESSKSETMDFTEPPPPRRPAEVHSPTSAAGTPLGMTKVSSICSLVSYGKDEAEFDKAEQEGQQEDSQSSPYGEEGEEPKPPPRISQDDESDGEDERLLAEAECQQPMREGEGSSTGSMTPQREADSPQVMDVDMVPEVSESNDDDELQLPPSPGECDPDLQARFESFFEKKAEGNNFNQILQNRKEFLNPSCYENFIEQFGLKEKGSNFDPEIFDPFCYPDNCFYDAIAEEQRKMIALAEAKNKKAHSSNR